MGVVYVQTSLTLLQCVSQHVGPAGGSLADSDSQEGLKEHNCTNATLNE